MTRYILIVCVLLASQTAAAFDEQREGFILGFGAGLHHTKLDFTSSGANIESDTKGGLATSLKIGAGLTNQLSISPRRILYTRSASAAWV